MLAVVAEPELKASAYRACSRAATARSKLSLGRRVSERSLQLFGGALRERTDWGSRSASTRTRPRASLLQSAHMSWTEKSSQVSSYNLHMQPILDLQPQSQRQ